MNIDNQTVGAVNLDTYLVFFALLVPVMGLMFWGLNRRAKRERATYFEQLDAEALRMSPSKIGVVYLLISERHDQALVRLVWDSGRACTDRREFSVKASLLVQFDAERFF